MKLVDIIVYNTERPVEKLEYFKDKTVHFIREPNIGLRFMFSCDDSKIYRTPVVTRINNGDNYVIVETENDEAYIFVSEGEDYGKD